MPKLGHFILHSNFMPQLTAGRYRLRSEHTGLPFPAPAKDTHVHVAAPRFTMPVDQILSSFPPANAEGAFGDRLPQIVLKRRTLPWERNPAGIAAPSGQTSETPWLALVVIAEGEAELSGATPVAQCVTPGTQLLDPDDADVQQGLTLNVTETVLKRTFPRPEHLSLLAHVREVDVADTELVGADDDGWLAVVLANRLPVFDHAAGKPVRYMACLINVEGQLGALEKVVDEHVEAFRFERVQDWSVLGGLLHLGGADPAVMGGVPAGVTLPAALQPVGAPRRGRSAGGGRSAPQRIAAAHLAAAQAAQARVALAAGASVPGGVTSATTVGGALDGGTRMGAVPVAAQWATKAGAPTKATQKVAAAALDIDAAGRVRDAMGIGFRYPIGRYALEKVYRFPVLAHWSFTTSEGATFERLMQKLDVGLLGSQPQPPELEPGGPPPPEPPPAAKPPPEVVQTGHIGLSHRTRRGDATKGWYRGACVPLPTPRNGSGGSGADQPMPLAHTADQLRRVVPDGREDLSLAAAFEIGRLLALSQLSVVSAMSRFRAEQFGAGRVRESLQATLGFKLPELKANGGAFAVDLGRTIALKTLNGIAMAPQRMLGPQRPVADPGRPLELEGTLEAAVAAGLGLDLGALQKRASSGGMALALQRTAVPVAGRIGGGATELDVVQLRNALDAELMQRVQVALPPKVVLRSRGGRDGRAGRPPADALDALIERTEAGDEPDDDEEPPR
jgi:hypothetical protein